MDEIGVFRCVADKPGCTEFLSDRSDSRNLRIVRAVQIQRLIRFQFAGKAAEIHILRVRQCGSVNHNFARQCAVQIRTPSGKAKETAHVDLCAGMRQICVKVNAVNQGAVSIAAICRKSTDGLTPCRTRIQYIRVLSRTNGQVQNQRIVGL